MIITASFCVVGHLIFGFGGYENSFSIMLAGRVVFGIGGEVLHASQNTLISNWFKASELSVQIINIQMVLGICLSFPKMGSSLNSYISPKLASAFGDEHHMNVAGPIFVGVGLMVISLVLAVGNYNLRQYWLSLIGKAIFPNNCIIKLRYQHHQDQLATDQSQIEQARV